MSILFLKVDDHFNVNFLPSLLIGDVFNHKKVSTVIIAFINI